MDYFNTFKASVVRIYHGNGAVVGAGFLITQKHILSCAHVITAALGLPNTTIEMPSESITLDFSLMAAGRKLTANVCFWQPYQTDRTITPDRIGDIAILELQTSLPINVQPVELIEGENYWGHSFRVFGFPNGHSQGIWASGVLRDRLANGWVQMEDIKAQGKRIEPGFSGAPIWDEQANGVVGMAVAASTNVTEKVAFLIPAQLLIKICSRSLDMPLISSSSRQNLFPDRSPKIEILQRRLKNLYLDYETAHNQLDTLLDDVQYNKIERRIEIIQAKIDKVEGELKNLS
ncbi:MAG: trypsin-like peptidase domain-containing protein [Spirulina sp.]